MKKVLFVIPSLTDGGAEKVVSEIASGLTKYYEVHILKFYDSPNEYSLDNNVIVTNLSNGTKQDYTNINRFNRIKKIREMIILKYI